MSIWDDDEIKSDDVDYIKLEAVGDTCEGVISAIARQTFTDDDSGEKKVVPKLTLRAQDGTERTLTAGQIRLKKQLIELRPEVGDHLKVTLTQIEPRGGKKKLKHFDVAHKRGNGTLPAQRVTAPAAHHASDEPPF